MNKICLISFHDLYLMQFLYKYTRILDENKIDYDVIYWNRENDAKIVRPFKGEPICYSYETGYYCSKLSKLKGYLSYIRFVKKAIKKGKYDKAILFTTQAALPMYLFSSKIRKKIKYIYDYRDITYEQFPFIKGIIKKIINKSYFTSISSMGFKDILGETDKLLMSHNCNDEMVYLPVKKEEGKRIRVTYWGMIRQVEFNKKIIDLFGNDLRFDLIYHGAGGIEELKEYCKKKDYDNVSFTGKYNTNDIPGFVSQTDILLNVYENDKQQKLATTVKLYDGIRYGLPMLITADSFMDKLMNGNLAVYALDINNFKSDDVIDWYEKVKNYRGYLYAKELNQIQLDDVAFQNKLIMFCNDNINK